MAKLPVPAGDELSYNGFTFDSTTSTELTITPVEDRAKRTHTHYVHELTARMKIATGAGAVAALARAALSQPAGVLVYRGRGMGVHRIGGPLGNPDLMWGPKPGAVKLKPLGGPHGFQLTWSVRWATMTCGDAIYNGQPMEFTYSVDFDVDYAGLTTRRYSAFLRIPQSRRTAGDRIVRATADNWRESATPTIPPGFRRTTPASARISEDKCELTLTCVDEEFASNIYPPGVVHAEGSYAFDSVPGNPLSWMGRLTATYELAKGEPPTSGLNAFFAVLQDKLKPLLQKPPGAPAIGGGGGALARAGLAPLPGNVISDAATAIGTAVMGAKAGAGGGAAGVLGGIIGAPAVAPVGVNKGLVVIPWSFGLTEPELYGRTKVQVTCQFKVVGADKETILSSGGLWRALPNSNWRRWITSVPIHQGPRGYAQLILDSGSDVIHDLCRPAGIAPPPAGGSGVETDLRTGGAPRSPRPPQAARVPKPPSPLQILTGAASGVGSGLFQSGREAQNQFFEMITYPSSSILEGAARIGRLAAKGALLSSLFPPPTPEASWLEYQCSARIENDSGVVIGKTLPSAPLTAAALAAGGAAIGTVYAQQRTVPTSYVVISGFGIRAGFGVPRPELVSVNGATPVACSRAESGEGFEERIAGNCGVPIHFARWEMRYALTGGLPKGGPPVPENSMLTDPSA